jgi:hypothetical protein
LAERYKAVSSVAVDVIFGLQQLRNYPLVFLYLVNISLEQITMKGVIFENQGAEPKVADDLEKPSPGPDQLLVKSIWTAINPV